MKRLQHQYSVIPGAHITAIEEATGSRFDATFDARGPAIIYLRQGRYELRVGAAGFEGWSTKDVEVNAETQRTVELKVGVCSSCFIVEVPEIPLAHPLLAAEIPLLPIQQFELTARLLRHKRRWF